MDDRMVREPGRSTMKAGGRGQGIRHILVGCLALVGLFGALLARDVAAQPEPPFDLQAAIAQAPPGSLVEVPPGLYRGPIVVDRPLRIVGQQGPNGERPIIDGGGQGTVVTITADGTVFQGFVVRNSGIDVDNEDGGITVDKAVDVVLADNRIEDTLYGIRGIEAHRLVLRGNVIRGKDLPVARRGDGIRLWQSENCLVEGNLVEGVRDAIFWFSDNTTVRRNVFRGNRYGVHMMYTDGMTVQENLTEGNSVGIYLMYSVNVLIENNTFRQNRGPSGYGLGLKDMDAVTVRDNYFFENRVGLFFDNAPASVNIYQVIQRNVLAYNDMGVLLMPAVARNRFVENTFLDNLEQVAAKGGGSRQGDILGANTWEGNYWSDYVGYDADGDGVGDVPYRSESLFENLIDRYPELRLFRFSPVQQTIEMAARAFPVFKPQPKLTDPSPRMSPVLPPAPPLGAPVESAMGWATAALLVLAFLGLLPAVAFRASSPARPAAARGSSGPAAGTTEESMHATTPPSLAISPDEPVLVARHLVKRYPQPGRPWWSDATITAVEDVSFQLFPGESLALWGANGAGKTTVLKCILGLLHYEGELRLNGLDLRRQGKQARRFLGYVPQELAFHNELTVADTCRLYARLKEVPLTRIPEVLALVGLTGQERKEVGALSGGMKQRLALALALLSDPPVLLLDEPTSNLDVNARQEFIGLLKRLRDRGKSLLYSSHHLAEVTDLADRVLVMAEGRIVAEGPPRAVMASIQGAQEPNWGGQPDGAGRAAVNREAVQAG